MSEVFASVDLGGTNITCVFAARDGRILGGRSTLTLSHEGPQAVILRIGRLVNDVADAISARPAAVGLGVPGLADLKTGATKFLPNFPTQWRDVPVREMLEPALRCPVHLLNDVRMATLGELTFGRGRDARTMAFFSVGTGVGGGIVVDGKLRLGPMGAAGELGHQTILPGGPLCGCGNRGCLETLVSGPAISALGVRLMLSGLAPQLRERAGGDAARITPKEIAEAARDGDQNVRAAIETVADHLGIGVANIINAIHPDLVVIGGGVAEMGDILIEPVRETVLRRVGMFPAGGVRVERSLLGDKAGALGGIALAVQGGVNPD